MKKKRKPGKRKHHSKNAFQRFISKFLKYGALTGLAGGIAFAIFVWMVSAGFFGELPSQEDLSNIKNNLATEIYSADGKVMGRYFIQQRTPTKYENISKNVIDALVATEDARFYQHHGIDYRSMLRVLVRTIILQDRSAGGGSTISQQLAKNLFPREESGLFYLATRKVKEALLAYKLESTYTKKEILTLYLNTVPFGENIYGIEMAAQRFFSKSAADLYPQEAAVLVGMLKANHTYNPRLFPDNALARRNVVLGQMHKYDYLTVDSLKLLQQKPLELNYHRISTSEGLATYFREQLKKKVEAWCEANTKADGNHYNMYTDGLKIYTTIDSKLQTHAEEAVTSHMKDLQHTFDKHWGDQEPWQGHPDIVTLAIKASPHYQQLKQKGMTHDKIMAEMSKSYPMSVFTWSGTKEKKMSPIDSIKHYLKFLHAGAVALDPQTGAVKTWIGGINHEYFKYDHAKQSTKRQVGSTFKPFVYAAALEKGIDPCDHISGRKTTYSNLANWSPDNADSAENELKYSFKGALAHSVNTVSIKLLEDVGINQTIAMAQATGIESELPEVPSIALGTADISLIEMATAYSAFANGGKRITPYFITRITDKNGEILYEAHHTESEPVMQKSTALMMNKLLESVVDEGTGARLRWKYGLNNELSGKTGTTQSNADGWFIGYNPALVMAVWVGADNPGIRFRSTSLGSGSNMALPIFGKTFQQVNKDPHLQYIAKASFKPLPLDLQKKLDCQSSMEDRNFFERLLNKDLRKKEKVKEFQEEEEEKKGFFKKIGDLFKKKDKEE